MARFRHTTTQRQDVLAARAVIGRSRRCDLRVNDTAVSGEHMAVWWSEGAWYARDLGSTNGSLRNGARLDPGETAVLAVGDVLTIGRSTHAWTIEDLDPPIAFAVDERDQTRVLSTGDVLALPGADDVEALVSVDAQGAWVVETAEGMLPIEDQRLLTVGDRAWRIHLPEEHRGTVDASLTAAATRTEALKFRVSQDEEYVELRVCRDTQTIELGARSHHYLLLLLARQRLEDAATEGPDSTHGWMHTETLTRMLQVAETHLNVQIFRARKQFLKAGCGAHLTPVERRPGAGLIRIGCGQLDIATI